MNSGHTTVKEFKQLIASIPEKYDDYSVTDPGCIDLEWIGIGDKDKILAIEFGIYPSTYPIQVEGVE